MPAAPLCPGLHPSAIAELFAAPDYLKVVTEKLESMITLRLVEGDVWGFSSTLLVSKGPLNSVLQTCFPLDVTKRDHRGTTSYD